MINVSSVVQDGHSVKNYRSVILSLLYLPDAFAFSSLPKATILFTAYYYICVLMKCIFMFTDMF